MAGVSTKGADNQNRNQRSDDKSRIKAQHAAAQKTGYRRIGKPATRDEIPPQLIGVVPSNTGGFGAADTAAEVFGANEIEPLQRRFTQLNEWIGDEVVRFNPYTIKRAIATA